ncbi:hypothetical protein BVX95_01120 [archaeon D22]|nr:hypothetical protein BVX95_01120 [archaeon D22]
MDKKRVFKVAGVEFLTLVVIIAFLVLSSKLLIMNQPEAYVAIENVMALDSEEKVSYYNELMAYMISALAISAFIVIISLLVFSVTRKLIFEKIASDKFSLKNYWKFTGFGLAYGLIHFLLGLILIFVLYFIQSNLSYLLSYVPGIVLFLVFGFIPLSFVLYSFFIVYYLGSFYYVKTYDIKKVFKELKKVNYKKFIVMSILFILGINIYNSLVIIIFELNSITASVFQLIGFALHAALLKEMVYAKEFGKKDKKKK